jgi:NTE family protein
MNSERISMFAVTQLNAHRTLRYVLLFFLALILAGCATRPVNPPITQVDQTQPYQLERNDQDELQAQNMVVLAFSGGGTRAAAFSYGVLEVLKQTESIRSDGKRGRLIDQVDVITGVSGGSFTALAYKLYGDRLFEEYEKRFLKRNVQSELILRAFSPNYWGALLSTGWGRSEMAADLYDEILFNGATFSDLDKKGGPVVLVSATDITSGSRVVFTKPNFDLFCTDLGEIRIARAAAASSAVPVVLSPLTINNYGGTCNYVPPVWAELFLNNPKPPRPASRVAARVREMTSMANGKEPFLHLVDGGVSDNVGLRGVLDAINLMEALSEAGMKTPLNHVKRIVVIVVNSLSVPTTDWAQNEDAPGAVSVLIKAAGVPIDRYSGEQIDQLKDMEARWSTLRQIRDTASFNKGDPRTRKEVQEYINNVPDIAIYPIDVSFAALSDVEERKYLNQLPTSFVLREEDVDRLRAAAGSILLSSPEFQRLLKDLGARVVDKTPAKTP